MFTFKTTENAAWQSHRTADGWTMMLHFILQGFSTDDTEWWKLAKLHQWSGFLVWLAHIFWGDFVANKEMKTCLSVRTRDRKSQAYTAEINTSCEMLMFLLKSEKSNLNRCQIVTVKNTPFCSVLSFLCSRGDSPTFTGGAVSITVTVQTSDEGVATCTKKPDKTPDK